MLMVIIVSVLGGNGKIMTRYKTLLYDVVFYGMMQYVMIRSGVMLHNTWCDTACFDTIMV